MDVGPLPAPEAPAPAVEAPPVEPPAPVLTQARREVHPPAHYPQNTITPADYTNLIQQIEQDKE